MLQEPKIEIIVLFVYIHCMSITRLGDRGSSCGGLMPPIGKIFKPDGEEVLVHKCNKCGLVRKNRIAGDDDYSLVDGLEVFDYF